jgi:CRP-like cAMP-binding protein
MEELQALNIYRKFLERFVVFDDAEWTEFTQHLTFSNLKKKQFFAVPDKVCDQVGFIVTGSIRYFHIKDGQDITNYFSFENELVSSYKSYLTNSLGITYIQAIEDTQLITFSRKAMEQMLANPILAYKMERFGRLVAEYYLCCYEDRVASFVTQTPEERYLSLLNTGHEILQRMPQHYIANFLGITPVSLSRIRRRIMKLAS